MRDFAKTSLIVDVIAILFYATPLLILLALRFF